MKFFDIEPIGNQCNFIKHLKQKEKKKFFRKKIHFSSVQH